MSENDSQLGRGIASALLIEIAVFSAVMVVILII